MSDLKWYSGGSERNVEAVKNLKILQSQLVNEIDLPLKKIVESYLVELQNQSSSVPLILSRFNIDVSKYLANNSMKLSEESQQLLKNISKLSEIRYGY